MNKKPGAPEENSGHRRRNGERATQTHAEVVIHLLRGERLSGFSRKERTGRHRHQLLLAPAAKR
jgi:hypothetical protein